MGLSDVSIDGKEMVRLLSPENRDQRLSKAKITFFHKTLPNNATLLGVFKIVFRLYSATLVDKQKLLRTLGLSHLTEFVE